MTAENIATSTPGIYTGHMSVFEMLLVFKGLGIGLDFIIYSIMPSEFRYSEGFFLIFLLYFVLLQILNRVREVAFRVREETNRVRDDVNVIEKGKLCSRKNRAWYCAVIHHSITP